MMIYSYLYAYILYYMYIPVVYDIDIYYKYISQDI